MSRYLKSKPRKILFISYNFPPHKNPESMITSNYVRGLAQSGFDSVVICGNPTVIEPSDDTNGSSRSIVGEILRISPLIKPLLSLISIIKRVMNLKQKNWCFENTINTSSMPGILKAYKAIYIHNRSLGWTPVALPCCISTLLIKNVEVIVSRSSPVSSHLVALILKILSRKPWIACFSDPWITDPSKPYSGKIVPERVLYFVDSILERKIMMSADRVVFTTDLLKEEYIHRFPFVNTKKFVVIPNSCDPTDFKNMINSNRNESFLMTYAGSFTAQRSPEPLFKALNLLDQDVLSKIRVLFVGNIGPYQCLVSRYGLNHVVEIKESVPHEEVYQYMAKSSVLLLIDAPLHTKNLPTKLVEYIFTGKPILAITPEKGSAATVVRNTGTGFVVSPWNVLKIKEAIMLLFDTHRKGIAATKPNQDEINSYSITNCVKALVQIIENIHRESSN